MKGHGPRAAGVIAAWVMLLTARALFAQISPGDLSHAHRALDGPLACRSCHGGKAAQMDGNCLSCHGDIARLRDEKRGLHARAGDAPCSSCHPEHAGRDFELVAWEEGAPEKFVHARAGWTLAGKHAKAECRACHQPKFQSAELMRLGKRGDPAASWLGLSPTCASCHADTHRGALGDDCAKCHGNDAWKPAAAFDHAATRFALTGKHVQVECAKCHLAPRVATARDTEGRPIPVYKPLPHAECSACHRDPHEGRLGAACASCHRTSGFADLAGERFNHGHTRFALRGAHAAVECARCHDPVKAWGKKPAFDRCDACHKDAHAGRALLAGAAQDCAVCHDERAFRPSVFTVERHGETRYPLEGKHREVECRACHVKEPMGVPREALGAAGVLLEPNYAACRDCHPEAHGKQLAARPDRGACESCHRLEGWKPTLFTAKEHDRLKLALAGRHAQIECAACHGPRRKDLPPLPGVETLGKAGVQLALDAAECASCHVDPHEGRLSPAQRPGIAGCASCHGDTTFAPSSIDAKRHREFGFALEGAHVAVPCNDCHAELTRPRVASTLVLAAALPPRLPFEQRRRACAECHDDPHGGQFKGRAGGDACETCHGQDAFKPAARFEHDRDTAFALRGAHASVVCGKCHPAHPQADGAVRVRYRSVPRECESCHGGKRMDSREVGSGATATGGGR